MSRALYREYRPRSLDQVVGQEHITSTLKNALKKGAISHAYLFTGPKGVGKTSIARILAHQINDIDYQDEGNHLDIIEIDAASNRRIDEIRDLRDKVHIAPTSSKYKVYIIDEVHMLTREAFNALLKTLEEPPEHAIFILATTEAHKIPDTITSRTQRYTFKPLDDATMIDHLRKIAEIEKISITDGALRVIAEHGNGSFRDSISILDQLAGIDTASLDEELVQKMLGVPTETNINLLIDSVFENDTDLLFKLMQQFRESGAQPALIAKALISKLRDKVLKSKAFNANKTINLMKELLPITGVNSSFEALEIALLSSIQFTTNDAYKNLEENANKSDNITPKPAKDTFKDNSDNESNKLKKTDAWQEVLNSVKGHHNTLYGLIRMADHNLEKDKMTLTFKFDFHKKRVDNQKNRKVVENAIEKVYGKKINVVIDVSPAVENKQQNINNYKKNDNLESVSNIFGGAELLES